MDCAYWAEGGEAWVADRATGRIVWHGRPDGYAALAAFPVPGSRDGIALLGWM